MTEATRGACTRRRPAASARLGLCAIALAATCATFADAATVEPAPRSGSALDLRVPAGVDFYTLTTSSGARHFMVYAPTTLSAGAPAVLLLHGGGGSMRKNFLFPTTARWLSLADEHGFLLVSPNGVNAATGDAAGDQQSWNGLRPGRDGRRSRADDVAFIDEMMAWSVDHYRLDPARLYATGASNGGEMVFRILIERPGLLAAGVANIASLPEIEVPRPKSGTPIMMMNGTADPLMPWNGGPVQGIAEPVRSIPATVDFWIEVNNADRSAEMTDDLPDTDPEDGCRIRLSAYPPMGGGPPVVVFYTMEGGGHATPFPREAPMPDEIRARLGPTCRDVDGSALAWEFMAQH